MVTGQRLKAWLLIPLLFLLTAWASAHASDEGIWECEVKNDGRVEAILRLPNGLINQFDKNNNGILEEEEIVPQITPFIDELIWIEGDGQRGKLSLRYAGRNDVQLAHTVVGAVWTFSEKPRTHTFHWNYFKSTEDSSGCSANTGCCQRTGPPKCIARITTTAGTTSTFVFTEHESSYDFSVLSRGIYGFFQLGFEHIFLGFDHLLFLAVLMLAGGSGFQLLAMIAAFTVAHSVALAAAVFGIFTLPGSVVEPLIALSVVVTAVENIRRDEAKSRWLLAGAFGCLHGMGFASVLLDMKISGQEAMEPLLGFNLGVEAGQLAVIFFALPVYYFVSRLEWNRRIRVLGSAFAGLVALSWLIG